MKKFISILLSVLILYSVVTGAGITVNGAEVTTLSTSVTSGDFEYILNGSAIIKGYTGSDTELEIPSKIDGYTVEHILNDAFNGCTTLTSVTIPASVKSIGYKAFYGCTNLTEITIPNSVTTIGEYVFQGCTSLTEVTIPNSVTSISVGFLKGCTNLISVTIPNSITTIGSYAFENCTSLTGIIIPDSVTTIGFQSFIRCKNLTNVTIGNNVECIKSGAFYGCSSLENINIPNSVTSIESQAFYECANLTKIAIPKSVTSIGVGAFRGCTGLTSITVDENNALYDSRNSCNAIIETETNELILGCSKTIIPDDVVSIGDYAFKGCTTLTSVTIPDSVTSIGNYAFYSCTGLTSVTIGDSVTSIGEDSFSKCTGLTEITIPESVISIGTFAFAGCDKLENIIVDTNNTVYDSRDNCNAIIKTETNELIQGCNTTIIPKSVTSIGAGAFALLNSLTEITIPNSITTIGVSAFTYCKGLKSITIPQSVTSIDGYTFYGCGNLIIYGYDGSYAQTYAEENYFTFVIIQPTLNETEKNMNSGDTFKITVKNANGAKVKYSISNADKKIIKVSAKGKVTALQKGNATVKVTVGNTTLKCKITVKTDPYLTNAKGKKITGVTVKKGGKATVYIQGKAKSLKNAYVGNKTAKISGNKSKAKFTVKGLKKGTTTVKVRINRVKTLNLKVKVK